MSEYQQTNGASIIRSADGANIPPDPANRDYAKYLAWVEAGGVPDPYVAPPAPVPNSASKLGLKRAFSEMGQWAAVKAMIASNDDLQEEWDLAVEIRRTDPLVQGMIPALGLNEAQVDALLIRAAELVA
jgi:hypothetical protein